MRFVIYGAGDAGAQLSMALASGRQFVLLAYVDEKRALQGTLMNGATRVKSTVAFVP